MIEVALVLSLLVRHWTDAVIIGVLLAMNGLVAFTEEQQAAGAIAALRQRLATTARVLRDGAWADLAARELVPGDVVRVRLGDVVPADLRVPDDVSLEVDQSALTGESLAVTRGLGEALFSGSVLIRGEGDAVVYATGASSFMGRTTALVQTAGTVSHFQRAVLRIGNYLIVIAAVLVTLTVVVSLVRGNPVLQTLEFALVVTIASVPVALPAVLSVTMAVGARKLAHQQAVVSHLPAVEELGGIDVLCSDKTGTLTQNWLALVAPGPDPTSPMISFSQRRRWRHAPKTTTPSTRPSSQAAISFLTSAWRSSRRSTRLSNAPKPPCNSPTAAIPSHQGRTAGDRRPVPARRRGDGDRRRRGRLCRPWSPIARRGPRGCRRPVAPHGDSGAG